MIEWVAYLIIPFFYTLFGDNEKGIPIKDAFLCMEECLLTIILSYYNDATLSFGNNPSRGRNFLRLGNTQVMVAYSREHDIEHLPKQSLIQRCLSHVTDCPQQTLSSVHSSSVKKKSHICNIQYGIYNAWLTLASSTLKILVIEATWNYSKGWIYLYLVLTQTGTKA